MTPTLSQLSKQNLESQLDRINNTFRLYNDRILASCLYPQPDNQLDAGSCQFGRTRLHKFEQHRFRPTTIPRAPYSTFKSPILKSIIPSICPTPPCLRRASRRSSCVGRVHRWLPSHQTRRNRPRLCCPSPIDRWSGMLWIGVIAWESAVSVTHATISDVYPVDTV